MQKATGRIPNAFGLRNVNQRTANLEMFPSYHVRLSGLLFEVGQSQMTGTGTGMGRVGLDDRAHRRALLRDRRQGLQQNCQNQ